MRLHKRVEAAARAGYASAMMKFAFNILAFGLLISMGVPAALAQDTAQPTLETAPLTIADGESTLEFTVELANDPEEIQTGMMFRESMGELEGMLFDMGEPRPVNFWMKNTLLSLDMVFIDTDGTVLAVAENAVPGSLRRINPGFAVKAVLELNGGTVAAMGIAPGDQVTHAIFPVDAG